MQYRKFGQTGLSLSALGFGTMRLPTSKTEGDRFKDNIIVNEAIRIIRHSIDQGVNYVDTAYGYHGGNSEIVTGEALKDGYREKVTLATKMPVWLIKKPEDFDRLLDEQLKKLQTDHIDCYLLHALNKGSWRNTVKKHNLLEKMEAAKKAGKIKHIGFSFHDDYDTFVEIIDGYDKWEFCQIQYNYMDIENQAGVKGLKYAAAKGLAVIIMEPLLGGRLANPPQDVREVLKANGKGGSPADWALQWLWNQPEVSVVLSGMSSMQQVEENLASANKSGIGSFSPKDDATVEQARQCFLGRATIPCTKCRYCMPCPNKVDIPGNFELYNGGIIYDDMAGSQSSYKHFFNPGSRANKCIACKVCETKCPQHIKISEWMPKVHETLRSE